MTEQIGNKNVSFPHLENLGEAGGVAFTDIRHVKTNEDGSTEVLKIGITGRGRNALEAFENLVDCLKYAQEKGWEVYTKSQALPKVEQASVPAPSTPAPAGTAVTAGASVPAPMPAQPDAPAGPNTFHIVKMVTTPRADGKISIGFFGEGHQYPDITKVCTVEQACMTLAPLGAFTPAHFQAVTEYGNLNVEVVWVESDKKNSRGVPYKNIVEVRNLNSVGG